MDRPHPQHHIVVFRHDPVSGIKQATGKQMEGL